MRVMKWLEEPTENQIMLINEICDEIGCEFDLSYATKQSASKFIERHINEYYASITFYDNWALENGYW